ncbi:MAG: glycosyltransferase family 39 protein [Vicinamibacterales bacterium]|nr:glycosyltransferase family 39 protein [Vicinamibacterales bacterium]
MTPIEPNERTIGQRRVLALAGILTVGFLLRVWNLGAGIPFAVGIDEPAIMTTVVRILKSGSFNPHFFEYPTGYIYVQLGAAIVNFLVGAMRHSWKAVEQVGPSDFYLWGRFVTAALGTATIALVHRAGLRWGPGVGLAAAGLLAVMPMHVRESHFVLTDVPMTFAVVLTLLLSLRASEQPTLRAFIAAGAAAGLAAGIKYNALMAFSMPLLAALALARGQRLSRGAAVLTAAGACVAAFFVTTPFALIDLPAFLNGFGTQAAAFTPRPRTSEASWIIYGKHLRQAFGWPAWLLAAGGALVALFRSFAGPARTRWALLAVFPAVYFYLINGWGFMFARYALPIVPFITIWAAVALVWLASRLAAAPVPAFARKAGVAVLVLLAVLPGAISSFTWVRGHGTETTQAQAWAWMKRSVWPSSMILSEARGLDLPPERYRSETVPSVAGMDPEAIAAAGVEWIVLSSDAWGSRPRTAGVQAPPAVPDAYAPILARAQAVKVIVPTPENPGPVIHILRLARR